MQESLIKIISEIDLKVKYLLNENTRLKEERINNKQRISEQKKEIEKYQLKIIELENKINRIKISKTIENKRELTETKLLINEIVREIDTCIGILNN